MAIMVRVRMNHFGAPIPICGVAGDQQAALIGQGCFQPGMLKATYGTGCFAMLNTGASCAVQQPDADDAGVPARTDKTSYALEGSIFMAGATMQWLRDGANMLQQHRRTARPSPTRPIPMRAFIWFRRSPGWARPGGMRMRAAPLLGMTRDTGGERNCARGLEAVGYQTRDLLQAMAADMHKAGGVMPRHLRVDGGMAANDWAMQFLADMTGLPVERSAISETTALGAAILAGVQCGLYSSHEAMAANWRSDRRFDPVMGPDEREARYTGWRDAVGRVLSQR